MVMAHSLRNTGRLTLETNQYNHNFLVLDGEGPGPGFVVTVPFSIQADRAPDPAMAEIRGNEVVYTAALNNRDRVSFSIRGFGSDATSYDMRVENRRTGAGVESLATSRSRVSRCGPSEAICRWSRTSTSRSSLEPR